MSNMRTAVISSGQVRCRLNYLQKYLNYCVKQIAISKYEWKLKLLVKIIHRVGHCNDEKIQIKSTVTQQLPNELTHKPVD